jgi:hypothetical protein
VFDRDFKSYPADKLLDINHLDYYRLRQHAIHSQLFRHRLEDIWPAFFSNSSRYTYTNRASRANSRLDYFYQSFSLVTNTLDVKLVYNTSYGLDHKLIYATLTLPGLHDKKLGRDQKVAMKKVIQIIFRSKETDIEQWAQYTSIVQSNLEKTLTFTHPELQ